MAKTESSAVNELIDLVQSGRPLGDEDDLFAPLTSLDMQPPRMTATVPAMRGAGEVAPLPPRRAPHATSENAQLPAVRMSTAPEHGDTIPPIANVRTTGPVRAIPPPRPRTTTSSPAVRVSGSHPAVSPPPIPRATQSHPAVSPPPIPRASADVVIPRTTTPSNVAPPVTHSSPTLPSPRTTMPSLPAMKPSVPTVPVPKASRSSLPPPRQTPRATEPPAIMPVVAPFEPTPAPGKLPVEEKSYALPDDDVPITADTDDWIPPPKPTKHDRTVVVAAPRDTFTVVKKLIAPTLLVGVMIGGYLAFESRAGKKPEVATPAPAIVAAQPADTLQPAARPPVAPSDNSGTASALGEIPQPPTKEEGTPPAEVAEAPAPAEPDIASREVKTTSGVVKLVDVRIDSKPAGATVMLVDGGKSSFLGTTPVATSLDASRSYDVVFTLHGRKTEMAHLDPATDTKLAISLHRASSSTSTSTSKKSQKLAEPSFDVAAVVEKPKADDVVAKPEKAVAKTAAAGEGTLMVSSKPPCEIYIDGKATGLTTPQRSISLPAGAHKVTFVNAAEKITKTVPVTITADQSTKLIQDLMTK